MHSLKMPYPLAGLCIQGNQAIGEQIIANSITAVEVRHRGTGRDINDSTPGIERHTGPVVGGAAGLPRVPGPGLIAKLPRTRNGMKRPAQLSGAHIERPDIARRRRVGFRIASTDDQQILVDDAWTGQVNRLRSDREAVEIFPQVNPAMVPEADNGPTRHRIQGVNQVHHPDQDSLVFDLALGIAIFPVGKSAVRLSPFYASVEFPQQLTRGGIQGKNLLSRSDSVEDAVSHNRAGL